MRKQSSVASQPLPTCRGLWMGLIRCSQSRCGQLHGDLEPRPDVRQGFMHVACLPTNSKQHHD
ncbi:hypothetical protein BCR44DRAFT_1288799 [Catenaria anguillulae PL171]|uniref:Uncharacterized protein n=1 Tax=Catenaria anguillulae PL171 TaxID=765915 RepID=A0A1Y2HCK2_9FUNG|nr:hypothetical protein BCR44DRAFT_1288799 [Catenaria anguillulae PL171]